MSVERSFEAWEEVQRHDLDFANHLAQGFTGLIQSHITPPSFSWPNPQPPKFFDVEFPTQNFVKKDFGIATDYYSGINGVLGIFDIGNRLGQAGADFGASLNDVVQQVFRVLHLPFKKDDSAGASLRADVNTQRPNLGITMDVQEDLGSLAKRFRDFGFTENDANSDGTLEEEISVFNLKTSGNFGRPSQPGCSSELTGVETMEAQLIQIKIISAGLWSQTEYENNVMNTPVMETAAVNVKVADVNEDGLNFLDAKFWFNWISSAPRRGKSALRFWKSDMDFESQPDIYTSSEGFKPAVDDAVLKINKDESRSRFPESVKESFREAIIHLSRKWYGRLSFFWRHAKRIIGSLWDISGIHLNLDIPKWLRILHLDRLNSFAVHWLEKRSKAFEPTFLYTMEKGYFLLPEGAKLRHNIRTTNISISARHSCFGNRWQQLLINRLVGYDTILMNSLLNAPGQGYLYNYQTKEFYNLTYAHEQPEVSVRFGDYFATKCGVLMMSMFVFFTTTMSVSFTLRETQTRMLKFTV